MGVPKTSDHIQIKIKMPNHSQEPPASSKAPNQDFKDMDILFTFKIRIESQNQIKINIPDPNQEPPVSFKAPNQDLNDIIDVVSIKSI